MFDNAVRCSVVGGRDWNEKWLNFILKCGVWTRAGSGSISPSIQKYSFRNGAQIIRLKEKLSCQKSGAGCPLCSLDENWRGGGGCSNPIQLNWDGRMGAL